MLTQTTADVKLDWSAFHERAYEGEFYCRTFAAEVLSAHGIPFPQVALPCDANNWRRVEKPRMLDVVVFNRGGKPAHVGVCIGGGKFVHVDAGHLSREESLDGFMWRSRIEGYYRYTGESCTVN